MVKYETMGPLPSDDDWRIAWPAIILPRRADVGGKGIETMSAGTMSAGTMSAGTTVTR